MVVSRSKKLNSWLVSSWKEGIDYEETLAPMGQIHFDHGTNCKATMEVHQMDEEIVFLNGVVKDEVYMEQSLAFETHD